MSVPSWSAHRERPFFGKRNNLLSDISIHIEKRLAHSSWGVGVDYLNKHRNDLNLNIEDYVGPYAGMN